MKRRDGIQKPLTFHLVGQAISYRRIDTEEIVDRVTVLGPVQPTHDVLPRIHRCQVLQLPDPIQEFQTLLIRWHFARVFRRHIMHPNVCHGLPPME